MSRLLLALLLMATILWRVDWEHAWNATEGAGRPELALAAVLTLTIGIAEASRLRVLLYRHTFAFLQLLRLHFVGVFWSLATPGQVGADLYRLSVIRDATGLSGGAALLLFQRMLAVAVMFGTVFLMLPFIESPLRAHRVELHELRLHALVGTPWKWFFLGLFVLTLILGLGAVSKWARLRHPVKEAFLALRMLRASHLAALTALSFGIHCLRAAILLLLLLSVSTPDLPTVPESLVIVSITTLASYLPLSIAGGLGIREGSLVVALIVYGISYDHAVLVALLGRGLLMLPPLLGGLWMVTQRRTSARSAT